MSIYATYDQFSGITPTDVVTASSNLADNAVVRGDGGGRGVQDSGVLIDDSDVMSGITQLNVDNIRIDGNTISSTDTDGNINLEPDGAGVIVSSGLTGMLSSNGASGFVARTLSVDSGEGLTISNADGTAGNPSYGISDFLRWRPSLVENIGISYSAGTFTVHGADGSALSATNPARITLWDRANFGQLVTYTITANQSFEDAAGTSEITGNLFGLTTGVATSVDVPFFLYACPNDAEDSITFGISRIPHLQNAPAIANLGNPSTATADVQFSIFLIENVTLDDYDGNPVLCIGSFRMRMDASDDWTVQALDTQDGIGKFNEQRIFQGLAGQFGANSGTFTLNNGGTAPVFGTNAQQYMITRDGYAYVNTSLREDAGTDGVGAVDARVAIPFQTTNLLGGVGGQFPTASHLVVGGGANNIAIVWFQAGVNFVEFYRTGTTVDDQWQWNDFTNGFRSIIFSAYYKIRVS